MELSFPASWHVQYQAMPVEKRPGLAPAEIMKAFEEPIGTEPLWQMARGRKNAVILFANGRPQPATPNHRNRGCQARDTVGDFRLEITPEIRLRDQMYSNQQTTEWRNRYRIRSGIEATLSELRRSHGIGRLRVRRAAKVCFAVACKVIACNIKRWAKAHAGLQSPLGHLQWTLWAHLTRHTTIRLKYYFAWEQHSLCRLR